MITSHFRLSFTYLKAYFGSGCNFLENFILIMHVNLNRRTTLESSFSCRHLLNWLAMRLSLLNFWLQKLHDFISVTLLQVLHFFLKHFIFTFKFGGGWTDDLVSNSLRSFIQFCIDWLYIATLQTYHRSLTLQPTIQIIQVC